MPHALFLGSSLASVDRLNMQPRIPEPPSYVSRKFNHKLPSVFRKRKVRHDQQPEGEYELDEYNRPCPPGPSYSQSQSGNVESEVEMGKDIVGAESSETVDLEMKRYEAAMKGFDRIKWVDIHLRHATVGRRDCAGLLISDRHDLQLVVFCNHDQRIDPYPGRCSVLL